MNIYIETIPHSEQRYPTTGDWFTGQLWGEDGGEVTVSRTSAPDGDLIVRVSDLGDWRMNALVGLHEAIEAVLCKHANVTQETVDQFDTVFEAIRANVEQCADLPHNGESGRIAGMLLANREAEPGDHPDAPYYRQHQIATGIERILATLLDVDWTEYEEANRRLYGG